MTMESLIVALLVLLAVLYTGRRITRLIRGRGGCTNTQCPSCPAHRFCDHDKQTEDDDN